MNTKTIISRRTPGRLYVESDGNGPYICANGHGRIATIECQAFCRNGGPQDWANAHLIVKAVNKFIDDLKIEMAILPKRKAKKATKKKADTLDRKEKQ